MRITGRMESKLRGEFQEFARHLLVSGDCVDHGSVAEVRGLVDADTGVVSLSMSAGSAVVQRTTAASERYVVDELVSMTRRMVEVLSA